MPEGLEAEIYRVAAESVVGRVIADVAIDERQYQALEIASELPGRTVTGVGRLGKQMWIDVADERGSSPLRLGLHFGMAGRLVVDGDGPIEKLTYSSGRGKPEWNRLRLTFTPESGGGELVVNDPRRWSKFVLDPDLDSLGPDLFDMDAEALKRRLASRRTDLKAVLLDQSVVAGLGNMLVDELLFQAGIAPQRLSHALDAAEVDHLVMLARSMLPRMLDLGGSHSGVLGPDRRRHLGRCPDQRCRSLEHADLRRTTVGGRTTIWCPVHQV